MKEKKTILPILPAPGYILCIPYIEKDKPFVSAKETEGIDQKSVVLAIGDDVKDSVGITRTAHCRIDDVILHASSNKEFEIDFTKYRFVHFVELHGIWQQKLKK